MPSTRAALQRHFPARHLVGAVVITAAIVSLFALTWRLREIFLLVFGAIVFAAIIRSVARPLITRFPRHEKLAVFCAVLGLIAALGGLFWLFGHQISEQLRGLVERWPTAKETGKAWLQQNAAGRFFLEQASGLTASSSGAGSDALSGVMQVSSLTLASIGHTLLMAFSAIYFAMTPRLYLDGTVRLFPLGHRANVRDAFAASGDALQRWLLGQLISMATIGTLTTLGLWAVGSPVPLALGILAGLLTFVPVVGFIVAFVPTVLIALSESPQVALAVAVVFVVVQQIEEQIALPLAQKWATSLPPALGLLALAAFGVLFGLPGLIFGCPLIVVVKCLVQKLYLEHGIEREIRATAASS